MIAWWNEDVWVFSKKGLSTNERRFIKESRDYNAAKSRRRQKRYGWAAVMAALMFVIGVGAFTVLGASGLESPSTLVTVVCLTMGGLTLGVSHMTWWLDERSRNNQTEAILKRLETDPDLAIVDDSNPFWSALVNSRGWQTYAKEMRRQSHVGVILSGMVESAIVDQLKAAGTHGSMFCDAFKLAEAMDRKLQRPQAAPPPT